MEFEEKRRSRTIVLPSGDWKQLEEDMNDPDSALVAELWKQLEEVMNDPDSAWIREELALMFSPYKLEKNSNISCSEWKERIGKHLGDFLN